ncbi:MAG: hypothetical protein ACK53Y_06330, partial [bacterium]
MWSCGIFLFYCLLYVPHVITYLSYQYTQVLQIIPESMFEILSRIIDIQVSYGDGLQQLLRLFA